MTPIAPNSLDHVALWVAERDALAAFVCDHLGMHEIDRTETFTLVGADARQGKLTLFDAEGPRERGVLERVVLRVSDLEGALARLPDDIEVRRDDGVAAFSAPAGLDMGIVERETALQYDLDHVVLRVPDAARTAKALEPFGFDGGDGDRLAVADRHVRLVDGGHAEGERPLLNHLALLVDSADDLLTQAGQLGLEVADRVDAPNTLAVFLWGPERIKLEYVEHKPSFSLV